VVEGVNVPAEVAFEVPREDFVHFQGNRNLRLGVKCRREVTFAKQTNKLQTHGVCIRVYVFVCTCVCVVCAFVLSVPVCVKSMDGFPKSREIAVLCIWLPAILILWSSPQWRVQSLLP